MIPLQVFTLQSANKTMCHGDFFQRYGRRSLRSLRAKFGVSLVTGTSASGPLANVPVTRFLRYRHTHVAGTYFRCTKSLPVTSIYCLPVRLITFDNLKSAFSLLIIGERNFSKHPLHAFLADRIVSDTASLKRGQEESPAYGLRLTALPMSHERT